VNPPKPTTTENRRHFATSVTDLDYHFVVSASRTLGISRSELLRRMIFETRNAFAKSGLYVVPTDIKSLRKIMDEEAKSSRPYYQRTPPKAV
jgi:hypothetical protein